MPRGGKRAGAGRKQLLPSWTRFKIAVACEEAQYKEAKNRIREQHKSRTKAIRLEREKIDKKASRFVSRKHALQARAFAGSSAMIDKLGRSSEYPITRPKALRGGESIRAKIITRIAKEFGVTPRMVDRCWKANRPAVVRLWRDRL
jgi:hypothetical protein